MRIYGVNVSISTYDYLVNPHRACFQITVAYPGGFLGCPETPLPAMICFKSGVTPLLAPTFTSHLNFRLLETPPLIPTLDTPLDKVHTAERHFCLSADSSVNCPQLYPKAIICQSTNILLSRPILIFLPGVQRMANLSMEFIWRVQFTSIFFELPPLSWTNVRSNNTISSTLRRR